MGALYVVATPIGNLEDVTLRALRVLREASLIAAEDTRTTRKLLTRYDIHTPVTSFHDANAARKLPALLAALRDGAVALVSDAGMPLVSDPGYQLVSAATAAGVPVVAVPGPSAVTAALVVSGLPADRFLFLGFLPRKAGERRSALQALAREQHTLVAFEAPHRLRQTLVDLLAALGDRRIAVCRELTKLHEEVFRGSVQEALAHFTEPRGEFTLVVEGAPAATPAASLDDARAELLRLRAEGARAKDAVDTVAGAMGLPHRRVYRLWLDLRAPPIAPRPPAG